MTGHASFAAIESLPAYAAIAFACRCLRRVRYLCRGHHLCSDLAPADQLLSTCQAVVFGREYNYHDTTDAKLKCEILDRLAVKMQRNGKTYLDSMMRNYIDGVASVGRALSQRDGEFGFLINAHKWSLKAAAYSVDAAKEFETHSPYYQSCEQAKFDLESVPREYRDCSLDSMVAMFERDLKDISRLAAQLKLGEESTVPDDLLSPL